jgi:ArsR family transcriptional regulator
MAPELKKALAASAESLVAALAGDAAKAELVAQMMKALGNSTRVRIVAYLCGDGERTVSEISEALGLTQAITSQQLAALRLNGAVRARREAGYRHYSLAIPELKDLMCCVAGCCQAAHGRGGAAA